MEFVNWDDDISNWMEKHVPNDQPDTIYTVDISIISEPRPSISMVKLTHFKRPTREGHLGALCYSRWPSPEECEDQWLALGARSGALGHEGTGHGKA